MTNSEKEQIQINLMKAEQELKQRRFRFEVLAMAQEAAAKGSTTIDPQKVVEIGETYIKFISSGVTSIEDTQKSMLVI